MRLCQKDDNKRTASFAASSHLCSCLNLNGGPDVELHYKTGTLPPRVLKPISTHATAERESMKFKPLHDRVVIRRLEGEEKTKAGIIIPDTAKEKPQEGEVVAVGPGGRDEAGKLIPIDLKSGDRVLFGKWSGTEVKIDGEELLIMKESDVMGVLEGAKASRKAA
jgi:chaperonin GroES